MRDEENQSRALKRRIAREGAYENKLATVKEVRIALDKYHTLMAGPRWQFLEEYVFYKKMKPWEKAWYHWLNLKGWCRARKRAFDRSAYARRWKRLNDAALGAENESQSTHQPAQDQEQRQDGRPRSSDHGEDVQEQ